MPDVREIPLALYVHIPWCERKCPYCDFNSHEGFSPQWEGAYTEALLQDLEGQLAGLSALRPLHSIFIGGGTPSLFSGSAIAALLTGIDRLWGITGRTEVTLEANPGSAQESRFAAYRSAGINRLSLGIQSYSDSHLKTLGRIHTAAQARAAIDQAAYHFPRFNIDLMHGLPNQTVDEAIRDLQEALQSETDHLSWYQLTLEPNTAFWSRPPQLPAEDTLADIQDAGAQTLSKSGFRQYEVSAWSKPGKEAQHNLNYWQFGDYIGIGAGAHGKLTQGDWRIERTQRTRVPVDYMTAIRDGRPLRRSAIPRTELPVEFMLNALRLREGVPLPLFAQRTGLDEMMLQGTVPDLVTRGLLTLDGGRLRTTPLGFNFLNDVLARFMATADNPSGISLFEQ